MILKGDCLDLLADMDADSVDGCVTDPPYHLQSIVHRFGKSNAKDVTHPAYKRFSKGFLGQQWDGGDIAHQPDTWAAVLRVLKPGAYLVAFAGTRTYHRMACAVEDAGFEIRDMVCWLHSQGFPKSKNDGALGTALKPAVEPMVLAQKPRVGTYAENHAKHGCGYLNVDEARVPVPDGQLKPVTAPLVEKAGFFRQGGKTIVAWTRVGRWPANVAHDGSQPVLDAFPNTTGTKPQTIKSYKESNRILHMSAWEYQHPGDEGGSAARFFYEAEPVEGEQDAGTKGRWPANVVHDGSEARYFYCAKPSPKERRMGLDERCKHPTMKPIELMRWLVRLVVPPEGVALDPFLGTGTTAIAAALEGRECVGIERDADYAKIAEARTAWWAGKQGTVAEILQAAPKTTKPKDGGGDLFGV